MAAWERTHWSLEENNLVNTSYGRLEDRHFIYQVGSLYTEIQMFCAWVNLVWIWFKLLNLWSWSPTSTQRVTNLRSYRAVKWMNRGRVGTTAKKKNCLAWTSGDHVGMWDHLWSDPDFQEEINIQGFVGLLPIFKYLNMHKCSKTTAGINKTCLEAGYGLCWLGDDFCPRPCTRKRQSCSAFWKLSLLTTNVCLIWEWAMSLMISREIVQFS